MNRLLTALLLTAFSCFTFSQHASANRPAMEDSSEAKNTAEEIAAETQTGETQPAMTSSVDIIMQQQTQQTGNIVQLPAMEIQPGETVKVQLLNSPRRGMSMDKVKNELGQPATVSDSIGQPPITRWIYNDRVVYFEHSTVLHVVAR